MLLVGFTTSVSYLEFILQILIIIHSNSGKQNAVLSKYNEIANQNS